MVIDFHTHIFPDALAPKTISYLEGLCGVTPSTDGTLKDLKASMTSAGIDYSVILPVVTKPHQFNSINRFAAEINNKDGIFSFGGIHPDCTDIDTKIAHIVSLGLRGIKLHPDYQCVNADDPRYVKIINTALANNLLVTYHAGVDIGLPNPNYATPQMLFHLLEQVELPLTAPLPEGKGGALIFAHTGGFRFWDDVERLLVGKPVYLDISFSTPYISDEQLLRIIRTHGAERILFATDSPWSDQKKYLQHFRSLPLTDEEKEMILWKNGAKLLGLI